ncbi:methyltransferase domain-containing protein [Ramlibacter terrae]|uniref:Methyltransferase domain-containing protein n=1 Tax=Ramlibacter terrae TaxID=2732511 RepID=A0ABX6P1X7_9BURK|nr:methyltransferase domain-containing protein [Ramlibacter terrae]
MSCIPWLASDGARVADFVAGHARLQSDKQTQAMYNSPHASEIYRNFLDWLFTSFAVREDAFRASLVERLRLQPGQRVLVTGCGLGEDLPLIAAQVGPEGAIYAQDLAKRMVLHARERYPAHLCVPRWSVGDAPELPFADGFFDAVFHFGGINLFGDMPRAIGEMARVTRAGGRVVFGDEGVAPWLRGTEYGRVAIANIPLWQSRCHWNRFPPGSTRCIAPGPGQCFYLVDFVVAPQGPHMDWTCPTRGVVAARPARAPMASSKASRPAPASRRPTRLRAKASASTSGSTAWCVPPPAGAAMSERSGMLDRVASYYSDKLALHGETPLGVDWNGAEGRVLRFEQLARVIDADGRFTVNDLGCGYGAFLEFLRPRHEGFHYNGYDVSEEMVRAARARLPGSDATFSVAAAPAEDADFGIASGIFNVRLGADEPTWEAYIAATLDDLHRTSRRGFAFNCLTSYSDPDRMRPDLHYADPCRLFDLCKRRFSRQVALLHDYGLYEFTILVRKS